MIISAGASSLGAFFVAYGGRCFNFFKRYSVGRWIFLHIESTEKVGKRDFRAVGNGILWLTPCKLACERSLETGINDSGERRRRSVVVASIVLTITDPLRGSYSFWYYLQAALIRSCGASFACMELTIISRFQRLQASTKS